MKRKEKIELIKSFINLSGLGLELGPHINPMFRKSQGVNVRYLESRSSDQLRELQMSQGRNADLVEEIDYILQRDVSLYEMVKGTRFEWVTSSHVIEHIPNFVGHLNEVASVLNDGGVYALIVPDRNYCFDCLKPPTSLGDVIEAHLSAGRPGALARMVNEWRYGVRPEGVKTGGWGEEAAKRPLVAKHDQWQGHVRRVLRTNGQELENWFGHHWHFDPISYADIVADVTELGLLGLQLEVVRPTYDMDFIVVFRKVGSPNPASARKIAGDLRKQYRAPVYATSL
jgi:hypothetical protein